MSDGFIRTKYIQAGIKNLNEYGYTGVTPQNIMTDYILANFFRSMLEEPENRLTIQLKRVADSLIAEIDKNLTEAASGES